MKSFSSLVFFFVLTTFWSFEKDQQIGSLDILNQKQYYDSEIFDEEHLGIYGKWELFEVSGGFAGNGHDFPAESYLEILKFGIYGFLVGDSIVSCGKIIIPEIEANVFAIAFEDSTRIGSPNVVKFKGKDTLVLQPFCADCYEYSYVKIK